MCLNNSDTTIAHYRKLLPKGYYIFTELAAKDALASKINAEAFQQKLSIMQKSLEQTSGDLTLRTIERDFYQNSLVDKEKTVAKLTRKLFFAKVLNYIGGVVMVVVLIK